MSIKMLKILVHFVVPWDMKIHVTETMKICDVDGTSSNGIARTLKKLR